MASFKFAISIQQVWNLIIFGWLYRLIIFTSRIVSFSIFYIFSWLSCRFINNFLTAYYFPYKILVAENTVPKAPSPIFFLFVKNLLNFPF